MKNRVFIAISTLFVSAQAVALSSQINVPVPNNGMVEPRGTVLKIPLKGVLFDGAVYDISCHVSVPSTAGGVVMRFESHSTFCSMGIGCNAYTVNDSSSYTQANLTMADNIVKFLDFRIASDDSNAAITFQNLDLTSTARVSQCVASPRL